MYGRCGAVIDCQALFSFMCSRDRYAWNFLMRALNHNEQGELAILSYDLMLHEACLPDKHIYASVVSACANANDLSHGIQMHSRVAVYGFLSDPVLGGNFVNMYGKCGQIQNAATIFHGLQERSAMCWTSLIAASIEHGGCGDAVELLMRMQREGTPVDNITFITILSACAHSVALFEGKHIHRFIFESGFSADLTVANSLINMYGKCGSIKDACDVFIGIRERDLVSWTSMIAAFAESEQCLHAWSTFCQMLQEGTAPNRVTFINMLSACMNEGWLSVGKHLHTLACKEVGVDLLVNTALINMYKNCGDLDGALALYRDISIKDEAANISILSVCASYGALENGREAHSFLTGIGADLEQNVCISLVNMYGKCGSLEEAHKIFGLASKDDSILWNTVAAAYSQNGQGLAVFDLFQQMQSENIYPDKATFSTLLTACSHTGLMDVAYCCFSAMDGHNETRPLIDQFNCMTDLLSRAGQYDESMGLVENMPLMPTKSSWLTLLSTCRMQVDVKLAESSARHVMELDQEETGSYVILANIYSHEQAE
ncbi:hypothetical protein KP509_16G048300 [Ceratopteris richardii]|nr:hypothetical protein KP509_16G048300 [Ceratopteris richardii]